MAKVIGNHGPNRPGRLNGLGAENHKVSGIHTSVTGVAGEVQILSVDQVAPGSGEIGIFVQATGAATIDYTLINPGLSTLRYPEVQEGITWGSTQTVGSDIEPTSAGVFAAVRITFTDSCTVYFMMR